MIQQFIHDMIHMTQGEKLVYYWPLWLALYVLFSVVSLGTAKYSRNRRVKHK